MGYFAKTENDDGELERLLLLQNYPGFRTKVRSPWGIEAPDELLNPTVTDLLDALGFDATPAPKSKESAAKSKARRAKMATTAKAEADAEADKDNDKQAEQD